MREIKFRFFNTTDKVIHNIEKIMLVGEYKHETLMQYTGLNDCKGVEIYEGDVVKVYDDDADYTFIGEVKFGFRGTPAFEIYDKDGDTYCDEYLTLSNFDLQFTVIGNIYENPGLLE